MTRLFNHYWDAFTFGFVASLLNVEYVQQLLLTIISITLTTFGKYACEIQIQRWKNFRKK